MLLLRLVLHNAMYLPNEKMFLELLFLVDAVISKYQIYKLASLLS